MKKGKKRRRPKRPKRHQQAERGISREAKGLRYKLVHADAFDWLAQRQAKSVQAVVTDPPYALVEYRPDQLRKRDSGSGGIWRLPQSFDGYNRRPMPRFTVLKDRDFRAIANFHKKLSAALFRVVVPGGHVVIASNSLLAHFVVIAFVQSGFELRAQLARTVNTFRGGDRPKFAHKKYADLSVIPRSTWEPWIVFRRPCEGLVKANLKKWKTGALRRPTKQSPFRDFIDSAPASQTERKVADHPSLKPQGFMRQIVRAVLPLQKGVILDPFAGSGATLAAARAEGLRSIGIEINGTYFQMAKKAIPKLAAIKVTESGNGNATHAASRLARRKKSARGSQDAFPLRRRKRNS